MKSYETEPRDNVASQPLAAENAEVTQSQANTKNSEEASSVAEPVLSEAEVTEVTDVTDGEVEADEHSLVVLSSAHVPEEEALDEEDEGGEDEEPRRRIFSPPTRGQILDWLPFWGIILLGAVLRFWGLGDKPLHHDESLHAYYSLQLMKNDLQNWISCFNGSDGNCYRYDPLLHGPFQFHAIALVYQISQWLHAPDNGVNTTTVRIAAATLGTAMIGLPYFLRSYLGRIGALLACFLIAVSPSLVYFSRFARESIYMAFFTLLMVAAVGCYVRTRKMGWLICAAAAFALSYATAEATFLTVAVFGSFLGALIAWELGLGWSIRARVSSDTALQKYLPKTGGAVAVALYFLIFLPIAKVGLGYLSSLAIYVTQNKSTSDAFVQKLKENTVAVVPWIGIILGVFVLIILVREMLGKLPAPGRHGLAKRIDPQRQPLLDTIFTMLWTHWFFALLCAWTIFLVLFTALFTNISGGIGDGVWQGLYYWLQQQQYARGGQPWYYYFLLLPLYEQIGVVFGLVGIVRCIFRPTRFRVFLVYWFVGTVFIYSWAAEKMPWLMIHMTMPMMLLAAIGLEPAVVKVVDYVKERLSQSSQEAVSVDENMVYHPRPKAKLSWAAVLTCVLAVLLLAPTLQNMYQVSYVHAADGPHEMMVYVQTTTDVNIVMAKVNELDQKLYGGKHLMPVGLMSDATWPFIWYLRDYPNTCLSYPQGCPTTAQNIPVIIVGEADAPFSNQAQYAANYNYHQYNMRTWWDEGYKPAPCVPSKTTQCDPTQTGGGVGPLLWLSYGDNPPPGATFNLGRAISNIWQWWWQRKAIGSTGGTYGMDIFIRKNAGVNP